MPDGTAPAAAGNRLIAALITRALDFLTRGEIADANEQLERAKSLALGDDHGDEAPDLAAVIGKIDELNGCEIQVGIDALGEFIKLRGLEADPILQCIQQCIQDKFQNASNEVQELCNGARS